MMTNASTQLLIKQINDSLPQTQCTKCGYQGCLPYAEAIAGGEAINRCPPGGPQTISKLSEITRRPVQALDPAVGIHSPQKLAVIREAECIGCTKCIKACPVDAIVGAAKRMHTVIAQDCTGCDLCVEPCPVDCIDMITVGTEIAPPARDQASAWQTLYEVTQARRVRESHAQQQRRLLKLENKLEALDRGESIQRSTPTVSSSPSPSQSQTQDQLRDYIQAAVARAQARKAGLQSSNQHNSVKENEVTAKTDSGNKNEQG